MNPTAACTQPLVISTATPVPVAPPRVVQPPTVVASLQKHSVAQCRAQLHYRSQSDYHPKPMDRNAVTQPLQWPRV